MKKRCNRRPVAVHSNIVQIALNNVRKLSASDVGMQRDIMDRALREFSAGRDCPTHWRSLADTANMAETLSGMGICSGQQADEIIHAGQQALAAVQQRHATRRTWTLYAAELDALDWLLVLHNRQLAECSYGEFERAFNTTRERIAQARKGNAPAGAIVIEGDLVGAA